MLTWAAHAGLPPRPHDLWSSWHVDPLIGVGLATAILLHWIGGRARRSGGPPSDRPVAFFIGVGALAVALLSPLEVAAGALASAHMVQHVLVMAVAAPALVIARPLTRITRGLPAAVREGLARGRGAIGISPRLTRRAWRPVVAWLAYVGSLWWWHAAATYEAAVQRDAVHAVQHLTYLLAALAFWGVVAGAKGARQVERGAAALMVASASIPLGFLSALLTFAPTAWYPSFADSAIRWGLSPLDDQRLAGVLMWIPMGALHAAAVLWLVAAWLRESEPRAVAAAARGVRGGTG